MAADTVRRLNQEIDWVPTDEEFRSLLGEVLAYEGVLAQWRNREMQTPASPMLTFTFRKGADEVSFFSTCTTFGAPHDVTLEELRIESSFPADERTESTWAQLIAGYKG